jgi:DNA polymerase-3 subunit delta'
MEQFLEPRTTVSARDRERLARWSQGSPGDALAIDIDQYTTRRDSMLTLLRTALGQASFAELLSHTEILARQREERIEVLADSLYGLLHDLLHLRLNLPQSVINADIQKDLQKMAHAASFEWIEKAAQKIAEIHQLDRRNIQKQMALEALAVGLRPASA